MIKIIVALMMWFPFSIPKDTTPKIRSINSYKIVAVMDDAKKGEYKVTTGKSVVSKVKVKIIIPDWKMLATRKESGHTSSERENINW